MYYALNSLISMAGKPRRLPNRQRSPKTEKAAQLFKLALPCLKVVREIIKIFYRD